MEKSSDARPGGGSGLSFPVRDIWGKTQGHVDLSRLVSKGRFTWL